MTTPTPIAERDKRESRAEHGTASRWRTGCRCPTCTQAHLSDLEQRLTRRRTAEWQPREKLFLAALAGGMSLAEAIDVVGVSAQAVTAQRRRDPEFARRLDEALTAGRHPDVEHGTHGAWRRSGCRCPQCRAHHEGTR